MLGESELSYDEYLKNNGKNNEKDKCETIKKLLKDNSIEINADKD